MTFKAGPKFMSGTITGGSHVSARLTVTTNPDEQIIIDKWSDGFTSMWQYRNGWPSNWDGDVNESD